MIYIGSQSLKADEIFIGMNARAMLTAHSGPEEARKYFRDALSRALTLWCIFSDGVSKEGKNATQDLKCSMKNYSK